MLKSSLTVLAILASLGSGAAYADGSATRTVTGPNGNTGTVNSVWVCQNGTCSWQRVATGPAGATAIRSGTAYHPAPGVTTVDRSVTRANGRTVNHHATITRN